ncbi:MAG: Ig-like domain-containing protein, partial [Acidobacteria bacterium]|nr:Ig-like domain-containing protein [Acidobacteriota bacterium]
MTRLRSWSLACCSLVLMAASAAAQAPAALTVVRTGPEGALSSLAQANEIRIVFSEPMVTLGRIPTPVTAPFVRIRPAVPGTFRWSGTTILIFTPDPTQPLPYATTYTVTVDPTAVAVSKRALARPVTFRFTTPTVKLLQTNWYRRGGTVNGAMVVLLRFNQPVRGRDIAAHLTAALEPHGFTPPAFTKDEEARLTAQDPAALAAFAAKVAAVQQVAASTQPVPLQLTTTWDRRRFPASPDLVVLETTAPVAPESWVKLSVGPRVPSPAGPATPGVAQAYTVEAEPAFFLNGFECRSA